MDSLITFGHEMVWQFLERAGFSVYSNEEYSRKILDTVREIVQLNKQGLISQDTFQFIVEILAKKMIEAKVEKYIDRENEPNNWHYWVSPCEQEMEKFPNASVKVVRK